MNIDSKHYLFQSRAVIDQSVGRSVSGLIVGMRVSHSEKKQAFLDLT
jgi:hypothetical protein